MVWPAVREPGRGFQRAAEAGGRVCSRHGEANLRERQLATHFPKWHGAPRPRYKTQVPKAPCFLERNHLHQRIGFLALISPLAPLSAEEIRNKLKDVQPMGPSDELQVQPINLDAGGGGLTGNAPRWNAVHQCEGAPRFFFRGHDVRRVLASQHRVSVRTTDVLQTDFILKRDISEAIAKVRPENSHAEGRTIG